MVPDTSFAGFWKRLKSGDEAAIRQLCSEYAPVICRAMRAPLQSRGLGRWIDPEDISQFVLPAFLKSDLGHWELESWEELITLLIAMAFNQLSNERRHAFAQKRGSRVLHDSDSDDTGSLVSHTAKVGEALDQEEGLAAIHNLMSEDEWRLACAWASGRSWQEIATIYQEDPECLRKKMESLFKRVRAILVPDDPVPPPVNDMASEILDPRKDRVDYRSNMQVGS